MEIMHVHLLHLLGATRLICGALVLINLSTQVSMDEPPLIHDLLGEADCTDIAAQALGGTRPTSGKYHLIVGEGKRGVWAYCDMETDGGGWTLFQRRSSPDVSFYKTWKEYQDGFGDPIGDHWLGNTYLHSMTVNKRYVLRIDLTDWDNKNYYAEYSNFVVGGAGCKYKLESIGEFCGDCGDSLRIHVGSKFSTFDQDNDIWPQSCAQTFHGAWWYEKCHHSNLNGLYKIGGAHSSFADGINWHAGKGHHYSYKRVEMKIRPFKY